MGGEPHTYEDNLNNMSLRIKIAIAQAKIALKTLAITSLGVIIGSSGTYISLEAPKLLTTQTIVIYGVSTVQADTIEEQPKVVAEETVESMIQEVFGDDAVTALAIANAESRLNAKAVHINNNGTQDFGVFQINSVHKPTETQKFNARDNIKLAKSIFDKSGWTAWSTYNNGNYIKFL
jgi:hypothetical protein